MIMITDIENAFELSKSGFRPGEWENIPKPSVPASH
jgi:hypothetical protein